LIILITLLTLFCSVIFVGSAEFPLLWKFERICFHKFTSEWMCGSMF
jgi:hypothetical protein